MTGTTDNYLRLIGTAGASTTLKTIDGASIAQAYPLTLTNQTGSLSRQGPANASMYYRMELGGGMTYQLTETSSYTIAGMNVYDSTGQQVATTATKSLTYVPPTNGTYYVELKTGTLVSTFPWK